MCRTVNSPREYVQRWYRSDGRAVEGRLTGEEISRSEYTAVDSCEFVRSPNDPSRDRFTVAPPTRIAFGLAATILGSPGPLLIWTILRTLDVDIGTSVVVPSGFCFETEMTCPHFNSSFLTRCLICACSSGPNFRRLYLEFVFSRPTPDRRCIKSRSVMVGNAVANTYLLLFFCLALNYAGAMQAQIEQARAS